MRIGLRSHETNNTVILEIPNSFTFDQLHHSLSNLLPSPSSPLYFSPNGKHNFHASSKHESLHFIGVRTGDVIFYSPDPRAFLPQPKTIGSSSSSFAQETAFQETLNSGNGDKTVMAIDKDEEVLDVAGSALIERYFWKRVLKEELANDLGVEKLLVTGVHAVLVESGLVSFDPVSGKRVNLFRLPDDKLPPSVTYTLPALLADRPDKIVSVVLRYQDMGSSINVYGSLATERRVVHNVYLDKNLLTSALNFVCENCLVKNNDCFEFWKMVKDGLALPFLIDICEKAGLSVPCRFQHLPLEIMFKILELVGGDDLARCACVCSELRYVASNDDLWKQKYMEEFGEPSLTDLVIDWRSRFTSSWKKKSRSMVPPFVPTQGSFIQDPPSGGHVQDPPSGGHVQHPPSGGHVQDPPSGGHVQHPPSGGHVQHPPPRGHVQHPPSGGHVQHPPPDGHVKHPPPGGHVQDPPPRRRVQYLQPIYWYPVYSPYLIEVPSESFP